MTLTDTDNKVLEKWFTTLRATDKNSEDYIKLRDKIYTYIYRRLMDMLKTKVYTWKRKFNLDEEDSISIFHDALLKSVDKYEPKRVKFITYFWQSCENTAKNYYKKYRCQRRIPTNQLFNVDFDQLHNQAELLTTQVGEEEAETTLIKVAEQLKHLHERSQHQAELTELAKDNIVSLIPSLTETEATIFNKIIEGHSISNISKLLNMKIQQVDLYVTKIQRKAMKLND